jgi:DNA polymerase-3 subunit gamma/tau
MALTQPKDEPLAHFASFGDVLELIRHHRDVKLLVDVETSLRLISYAPGRIDFEPTDSAPRDLAQRLGVRLKSWSGNHWAISIGTGGGATIAETKNAVKEALKDQAKAHPLVMAVFDAFPKAKIINIRTPQALKAEAHVDALPEIEDEWDPFDEE